MMFTSFVLLNKVSQVSDLASQKKIIIIYIGNFLGGNFFSNQDFGKKIIINIIVIYTPQLQLLIFIVLII